MSRKNEEHGLVGMHVHEVRWRLALMASLLIVAAMPIMLLAACSQQGTPQHDGGDGSADVAHYVNPFIGTEAGALNHRQGGGDGGNVFPGASFPHGMVQWSPDTTNAPGGYRYNQSTISGFSLTHFSGRGCSSYQDIPFMPTIGPVQQVPASSNSYSFSHEREAASPGYYKVELDTTHIQVALTVTLRTGFAQFTYPSSQEAALLIQVGGSANGNSATGTGLQIVGHSMVVGSASSGHFCGQANTYTVYFAALFEQPFTSFGTWNGPALSKDGRSSSGSHSGAYLTFDTTKQHVVQVKVGVSFVSISNAQLNLQQENPQWDFNAVRERASSAWNAHLHQIQVDGGTRAQKIIFYTALYHTLFHPNVFSDVNGQYIGFDSRVHVARGYVQYENFPGWDMYRSLIALRALLEPREVGDMLQSLVADAQQGGGGLPRWQVANDNSAGMVGDSEDAVIATSYALGVRNFDVQAALQAMNSGASQADTHSGKYSVREWLDDYLRLGYVPASRPASASITLEYATDDFALAQFARAVGNSGLYAAYMLRSANWQHLFNPTTGYIEPRSADGSFVANFSPTSGEGFAEGDSMQYSWMVPYDLPGLFKAMGGNRVVIQRLDRHFTQLNAGMFSPYANMGNEPEFEVPWEYDFAGAAPHTQAVIRRIEEQLFLPTADGLPGNDDGGAMSSWYVFAAMGLYPEIPGVGGFAIGSPLFPTMTVHLGNGRLLHILGQGAGDSAPYVQSFEVNGQPYTTPWLPFSALAHGATLQFTLSTMPAYAILSGQISA